MNIPILMYHEIYRPEERRRLQGLTNPAYNLQFDTFERQIAWLAQNRIKALTIEDLVPGKAVNDGRAVCLTFDDGLKGNYLHAFPALIEQGFRATFFVAAGLIGRENYMTWEQLGRMQSSGMSIQSHALTHRPLTAMKEADLLFELRESKNIIEDKLSARVSHLSLPHGQKEERIWDFAREIGYRSICTSDVGFHIPGSRDPWLKRISIGDGMPESRFRRVALAESKALRKIAAVKWFKNALKKAVGFRTYRYLYKWVYGIRW
jgi:peptidoglycan/xylan/chitin deacetylase (PgdA/CDA1 family)